MRVLDLDLDFFLDGVASWRMSDDDRLPSDEYSPWPMDQAMSFLRERCLLDTPLPGRVVDHHGEVFGIWREELAKGMLTEPFHVTHLDGHADLGLGDSGWSYLMTDLLYREPSERTEPREGDGALGDGNYLSFAIACRWITDLTYIYCEGGGGDVLGFHYEDFDRHASNLQLKAMDKEEAFRSIGRTPGSREVEIDRLEPLVPFRTELWRDYRATEPFDRIYLSRSPGFTPIESDDLFDAIRERFIDEMPPPTFF